MRLYNCNADCTANTLKSYNTYVFWVKGTRFFVLFLYPSVTSKSHKNMEHSCLDELPDYLKR